MKHNQTLSQSDLESIRRRDYMMLPAHNHACQSMAPVRWATCVDKRAGALPCAPRPGATLFNLGNRRRNDECVRRALDIANVVVHMSKHVLFSQRNAARPSVSFGLDPSRSCFKAQSIVLDGARNASGTCSGCGMAGIMKVSSALPLY